MRSETHSICLEVVVLGRRTARRISYEGVAYRLRLRTHETIRFTARKLTAGNRPAIHGAAPCTTHYNANLPLTKSARRNLPPPTSARSNAFPSESPAITDITSLIRFS